jgi:hypothetical protein
MGGERAACTSSFFASPMECFFGSLKRWRWAALVGTHGILDEGQQEWCGWGAAWWDLKYFITASFHPRGHRLPRKILVSQISRDDGDIRI